MKRYIINCGYNSSVYNDEYKYRLETDDIKKIRDIENRIYDDLLCDIDMSDLADMNGMDTCDVEDMDENELSGLIDSYIFIVTDEFTGSEEEWNRLPDFLNRRVL